METNETQHSIPEKSRPNIDRKRHIGPWIVIGVVLLVVFLAIAQLPDDRSAPQQDFPPDAQVFPDNPMGPTPDVDYILEDSERIQLTDDQISKLQELHQQQREELDPVLKELEDASDDFDAWLRRQRGEGTESDELQAGAADMVRLSDRAIEIRDEYWEKAMGVLTEHQQHQVDARREREWRETLERMGLPVGNM